MAPVNRSGKHSSADLREKVVLYWQKNSVTYKSLSEIFSVPVTTVKDWIRKYKTTGSFDRSVGSGRPRCTTERTDRRMVIDTKKNPFIKLG